MSKVFLALLQVENQLLKEFAKAQSIRVYISDDLRRALFNMADFGVPQNRESNYNRFNKKHFVRMF